LLGVDPVLVESSEGSLVEVVSPNSGKSSQSSWGFNVSNQTNNFKRWGLDHSDGLNFFFFIEFGFGSVNISEDVSHTSFESTEGSEVRSLGSVISGE